MRGVAFGLCVTAAVLFSAVSASAGTTGISSDPTPNAGSSTPASINDHDGGITPHGVVDRGFAINPDGPMASNYGGDSDQDKDGSDIAIYQGEDDQLPS
jgi:hypothetical protein